MLIQTPKFAILFVGTPLRLFMCRNPLRFSVSRLFIRISAPMKALASEIVRKLGKRLKWLSIEVRELTGASPSIHPTS